MLKSRIQIQAQLFLIWVFNCILKILPTHILRINFLKIFNAKIGDGTALHYGCYFTRPGRFSVGKYCTINFGCYFDTRGGIKIMDSVMIGHRTRIYTAGHILDSESFSGFSKGVIIGDHAVIFPNSQIMPGVTVGRGSVVLTGSVVTKNIEDYVIVGGNPANPVGFRSRNLNYKHQYKYWLPNA